MVAAVEVTHNGTAATGFDNTARWLVLGPGESIQFTVGLNADARALSGDKAIKMILLRSLTSLLSTATDGRFSVTGLDTLARGFIGFELSAPTDTRTVTITAASDLDSRIDATGWGIQFRAFPAEPSDRLEIDIWRASFAWNVNFESATAPAYVPDFTPDELQVWAYSDPSEFDWVDQFGRRQRRFSASVLNYSWRTYRRPSQANRQFLAIGLDRQFATLLPGRLTYSFPGATDAVEAAAQARDHSVVGGGVSFDGNGLAHRNYSLHISTTAEGFALFGDDPKLRMTFQISGKEMWTHDFPLRLLNSATPGVEGPEGTSPYGLVISPASLTVPIGGSLTVTVTRQEPTDEDIDVSINLPDGSNLDISPATATIPGDTGSTAQDDGEPSVTFRITDTAGDGERDVDLTVVVGPTDVAIPATVSVRQEAPTLVPTPAALYTVDGLIQSTDDPDSVGYEMDASWGGESVFKDGAWHYLPGHARAPVAHISPADILAYDLRQIGPDAQDRINAASMSIAQNKDGDYLPFRLDTQVLEDARLVDGTPYEADLGTRGFITDSVHARQALSIALRRTRYPTLTALRISPGAKLERLAIHPGDIVTYTDARYGVYGERNRVMSSTVHPDLSMTLSLRGEPVTTYDPALPYLPPAAPTEPLWQRLFLAPDGSVSGSAAIMAADGNKLLLRGEPVTGSAFHAVEYSTAGEKIGTSFQASFNIGGMRALAFHRAGGDLGIVGLWSFSTTSRLFSKDSRGIVLSNPLPAGVWNTDNMALRHGPGVPSGPSRAAFVAHSSSNAGYRLITADFNLFGPPGADGRAGGTVGALSTYTGDRASAVKVLLERLDGSLLGVTDGGDFLAVSSSPALFTFQGVGDEKVGAAKTIQGACIAPDGRLYCIGRVSLGDTRKDYVYVRRNATEPDEERG